MKIYGWKELFEPHILMRGQYYAQDGAVEDIHVDTTGNITATVYGTEEYAVEIELDGNKIVDMDCDCPYSQSGNYCKHEAAVLYELTSSEDIFDSLDYPPEKDDDDFYMDALDIIKYMGNKDALQLLVDICSEVPGVSEYIVDRFKTPVNVKGAEKINLELLQLEEKYSDEIGFLNADRAYSYLSSVLQKLEKHVPRFIEARRLMDAFEITTSVMEMIVDVDLDDSYGGMTEFYDAITRYWDDIFELAVEDDRKRMLETLRSMELDDDDDVYWDVIHEFRINHQAGCDGRDLLYKEDVEYLESHDDPKSRGVRYEHIALDALDLLISEKTPGHVIREFIWRYGPVFGLEIRALEYLEANQFWEDAYELMVSLYSDEKNYHGISRGKLAYKLYEYRKAQEPETALELFRKAVLEDMVADDVKIFRLLKDSESDELWTHDKLSIRMRYLRKGVGNMEFIAASLILIESGMCSAVLDFLEMDSDCSFFMSELREALIPCDAERTWNIDRFLLMRNMDRSFNRGDYSLRLRELEYISSLYPDGDNLAREVAEDWKSLYPKKTAMLDEISKAGL